MTAKKDKHSTLSVLDGLDLWLGLNLLHTTSKPLKAPPSVYITKCHHYITQPSGLLYFLTHCFK